MPEVARRFVQEILANAAPRVEPLRKAYTPNRQPVGTRRPAAPPALGRPVLPRIGRSPVSPGRRDAAHRAPPENHARARRRGAGQPVLRGQHAHPRELRRGVLPAGRLGVRHHRLHVLVDGQGRVDLRHQPRDRAATPTRSSCAIPSKARWPSSRAPPTCRWSTAATARANIRARRCSTCTRSSASSRGWASASTARTSRWSAT